MDIKTQEFIDSLSKQYFPEIDIAKSLINNGDKGTLYFSMSTRQPYFDESVQNMMNQAIMEALMAILPEWTEEELINFQLALFHMAVKALESFHDDKELLQRIAGKGNDFYFGFNLTIDPRRYQFNPISYERKIKVKTHTAVYNQKNKESVSYLSENSSVTFMFFDHAN